MKIRLLIAFTAILLIASAISVYAYSAGTKTVVTDSDGTKREIAPFRNFNACIYVHRNNSQGKYLDEDFYYPESVVDVTADDNIDICVANDDLRISEYRVIIKSAENITLFETQLNDPGNGGTLGIKINADSKTLRNNGKIECIIKTKDGTTEQYSYTLSVQERYVPLQYTTYYLSVGTPDLHLVLECDNIAEIKNPVSLQKVSVTNKKDVECFNAENNEAFLLSFRLDKSRNDMDAELQARYNTINIPFTRIELETEYCVVIPKGTLLLDGGWNEEFTLDFVTDTAFADEREYLISTEPLNTSIVYLNAETESLPMSVELSKDCVIDPNMKIEVNDIPVNYQIADEGDCYKLSFNSDVKADTHYWIIFENDKITLPNGTKNWKLYFEFDTVLRSSIDLPDSAVFIDLPQNHWAYRFISELSAQGIISGYGDKTFKPENNVTRAELAKLLYVAFNVSENSKAAQFTDTENHWAAQYISVLANIIPYSGNIFRPNDPVTREEAAASIARLSNIDNTATEHIDFTDTAEINPALLSDISYAVNAKIIYGYEDGSFHPRENIYRSEIAAMLYRAMSLE